jgi:hypothetical protein
MFFQQTLTPGVSAPTLVTCYVQVFNLKVDCQLSREYFTSEAIYNGSAGRTLYYYMCRSWRGENWSWPSVSAESVDSECWCLNNAIFYTLIMWLTVEECVFILESYLKTMPYAHCWQSFFEKLGRQAPVKSAIVKMIKKWKNTKKSCKEHGETCRYVHWNEWTSFQTLTVNTS